MSEDITLETLVPTVLKERVEPNPRLLEIGHAVTHRNSNKQYIRGVIEKLPTRYIPQFIIRDEMPKGLPLTSQTWLLPEQLKPEDQLTEAGDWYCKNAYR